MKPINLNDPEVAVLVQQFPKWLRHTIDDCKRLINFSPVKHITILPHEHEALLGKLLEAGLDPERGIAIGDTLLTTTKMRERVTS